MECASVFTFEADRPEIALSEIQKQLAEKIILSKNTVGIVMCHPEFIATGVLKHVCENLPFDLAGITTSSQAVNGMYGYIILTIFVMTSDDVSFVTGVTEGLAKGVEGPTRVAYEKSIEGISGDPKLAVIFPPFMPHDGDSYVRAMEKAMPGAPIFGTLSIDDTATFNECETIFNGTSYKCEMPFIIFYGNIKPRFLIATVSDSPALSSKIAVTKSSGKYVYEINNMNAFEFFSSIGLVDKKGHAGSFQFFPFKVNLPNRNVIDDVPVIRGLGYFTEEGAAVFYGDVEEGSTLSIIPCDVNDILVTTTQTIGQLNEMQNVNGALLFPCSVRRAALQGVGKASEELQSVMKGIKPEIPHLMGYAGGEICPVSFVDGVPENRFHNYSLVILIV